MEETPTKTPTGFELKFGTYEQAKETIGAKSDVHFADVEVNAPMIAYYAALLEDGNPSYWDEDFSRSVWGGIVSPPGMLMSWLMPLPWKPSGHRDIPLLATQVPLPGDTLINVSTETEFFRPILAGERLNVMDEVKDVTPMKQTRLGKGHFIKTVATFRDQKGRVVAKNTNVMFRFSFGS
jgi:acyl dehydratase